VLVGLQRYLQEQVLVDLQRYFQEQVLVGLQRYFQEQVLVGLQRYFQEQVLVGYQDHYPVQFVDLGLLHFVHLKFMMLRLLTVNSYQYMKPFCICFERRHIY
jgi:hypothetical protein